MKKDNVRNTIFLFIGLGIWTLMSMPLSAQNRLSLGESLQKGLNNSFKIKIAQNKSEMAQNEASWTNAGLLPSLEAKGSYDLTRNGSETTDFNDVKTTIDPYNTQKSAVGVAFNWMLFNGLYNQTRFRQLKTTAEIRDIQRLIEVEDYILSIADAYYGFIAKQKSLEIQQQIVALGKERIRIAELRHTTGAESRLGVLQSRVQFNADSARMVALQTDVQLQLLVLNKLMLMDPQTQWTLTDDITENTHSQDSLLLMENTLAQNTSLLLATKDQRQANLSLTATRSKYFPSLSLNGGYNYQYTDTDFGNYNVQEMKGPYVGVALKIPIFDGQRHRSVRNAKIEQENAELAYKNLQWNIQTEVINNWLKYQNYLQLVEVEKNNVEIARVNYSATLLQYKQELVSGITLTEALNNLRTAENNLLQMNYNAKLQEIFLIYLSGNSLMLIKE